MLPLELVLFVNPVLAVAPVLAEGPRINFERYTGADESVAAVAGVCSHLLGQPPNLRLPGGTAGMGKIAQTLISALIAPTFSRSAMMNGRTQCLRRYQEHGRNQRG